MSSRMLGKKPTAVLERLLLRTSITTDGCWLYQGAVNGGRGNYGVIGDSIPKRRQRYAHRVMFEAAYGPVPEGHEVAHTCDVPTCVRPSHLIALTHKGNVRDMMIKNRQSFGDHHAKVLNTEKVRAIRKRVAAGERRRDLAGEYGVSISTIDNVVNRKQWTHID